MRQYILKSKTKYTSALRRIILVIFAQCLLVGALYAQTPRITINVKEASLSTALSMVQSQSKMKVFYNNENIDTRKRVSVSIQNATVDEALKQILSPYGLNYKIVEGTIVISSSASTGQTANIGKQYHQLEGVVVDKSGAPLPGVNVFDRSTPTRGSVTDANGRYKVLITSSTTQVIYSFVGMATQTVPVNGRSRINVSLEEEENNIERVVVTGFAPKAKNSFTGTAVQVKGDELRSVNPVNLMDAMKVFDPSFNIIDVRGLLGSDPNAVPQSIQIRGANGFPDVSEGTLKAQTNLPVFILDGFPIDVQQVYDLDINRVQSITILKDAAGAAIYGSRAANGVVVIETKAPEEGKLRVSYTFNGTVETPDLSSYNLMNARESLEYLRLSKGFGELGANGLPIAPDKQIAYSILNSDVNNGVNTYWLAQPLQTAFKHEHSLMLEGGSKGNEFKKGGMRYQANIIASPGNGVMKGSGRSRYGAGLKLLYNRGSKLQLVNDIQVAHIKSTDSPYGSFRQYGEMFPFYRMYDDEGRYYRTLGLGNIPKPEGLPSLGTTISNQYSPIYNALYTDSYSRGETTNLTYNLGVNWAITDALRVRSTFSINNSVSKNDVYKDPRSAEYYAEGSNNNMNYLNSRGSSSINNSDNLNYNGNVSLSYTKEFNKHLIQTILGGEMAQANSIYDTYLSEGFMDGLPGTPSYGLQFKNASRPSGDERIKRSAGAFMNINYGWDNRYMFDLTGRVDGSSNFASNQRTAPFWSAGFRWNLYNEEFMKRNGIFENLALRANIGTTGNQNFSLSQIRTLYKYSDVLYDGFMGAVIESLANPDLKWQVTMNRNIGLEFSLLNKLINFDFNYYYNTTKNSINQMSIAPSMGFTSYTANLGTVENKGIDFSVSVTPIRKKDFRLNISVNGTRNVSKIAKIAQSLKDYNDKVIASQMLAAGKYGENVVPAYLFEEGSSLNTIYAVRSLGIDPETGKEVFIKKNGQRTFDWNAADQVAVGIDEPELRGFFNLNIDYKNWNFGAIMEYSFGAQKNNYALLQRIETQSLNVNADRRALYDRWQKPGDIAMFKGFGATGTASKTNPTSRFVQNDNYFSMTQLRLTYSFNKELLQNIGVSMAKLSISTNDLFYVSSIRQERGIEYPFARKFFMTLQVNF